MRRTVVLVWINGAFGSGKTTVGQALAARWPAALVYDPEEVGFMVRRILPAHLQTADFQELPLWRELTVATARALIERYRRPLVVPMTLVAPDAFAEIMGGLRDAGIEVRHFALLVPPSLLRRRLRRRWARPRSTRWALAQVDRCAAALARPEFAVHLSVERRGAPEVVEELLAHLPDPLPDTAATSPPPRLG